jgi:hypothetical protein
MGESSSSKAKSPAVKLPSWLGSCLLVDASALALACSESGCSKYCGREQG